MHLSEKSKIGLAMVMKASRERRLREAQEQAAIQSNSSMPTISPSDIATDLTKSA